MIFQTALIVDDSRLARLTLNRLLARHDIKVFEAESVMDAKHWLSSNPLPDIIFMDMMMPGLDGFEGLAHLQSQEETSQIPVIMYSADISEEARKKARACRATGYLSKPADAKRLNRLLKVLTKHFKEYKAVESDVLVSEKQEDTVSPIEIDKVIHTPLLEEEKDLIDTDADFQEYQANHIYTEDELPQQLEEAEEYLTIQDDEITHDDTEIEYQLRDLIYLQEQLLKSEKRIKLSLLIGGIGVLLALISIAIQLF